MGRSVSALHYRHGSFSALSPFLPSRAARRLHTQGPTPPRSIRRFGRTQGMDASWAKQGNISCCHPIQSSQPTPTFCSKNRQSIQALSCPILGVSGRDILIFVGCMCCNCTMFQYGTGRILACPCSIQTLRSGQSLQRSLVIKRVLARIRTKEHRCSQPASLPSSSFQGMKSRTRP